MLREALTQASPLSPWPLHARDLRRPVTRLVWAMQQMYRKDEPAAVTRLREICAPLVEALQRSVQEPWMERWWTAMNEGNLPEYGLLIAAEGWLKQQLPGQMAALEAAVEREWDRLRHLLESLSGQGRIQIIAAAGRVTGAEVNDRSAGKDIKGLVRDDYVQMLEAMFERAVMMLGEERGQRLWCRVATRHVQQHGVRKMELRHWQVGNVVQSARDGLTGTGGLRVLPMNGVERYDGKAPPGLVLADLVANALRPHIVRGGSFGVLSSRIRAQSVLGKTELRFHVPRLGRVLPTLAANGEARRLVRAAARQTGQRDEMILQAATLLPKWTGEQADAWIRACGEGR